MEDMYVVRRAMERPIQALDILREEYEAKGELNKADCMREAIKTVREGISSHEYQFIELAKEQITEAFNNSFSTYMLVDEIKEFIQDKVEEAKEEALDQTAYFLECNHGWSEEKQEELSEVITDTISELIRDACVDEGGFDI